MDCPGCSHLKERNGITVFTRGGTTHYVPHSWLLERTAELEGFDWTPMEAALTALHDYADQCDHMHNRTGG